MTKQEFLRRVMEGAGLGDESQAEQATRVVFELLQRHLDPKAAGDVAAQLPQEIRNLWHESAIPGQREEATAGGCCEVQKGDWVPFLIGFTNAHAGQPVQIQVGTEERGFQVLASSLPLIGIEPECKQNKVLRMDVSVGQTQGAHPDHLVHYVQKPDRLVLETDDQGAVHSLIMEAEDGLLTWVRLAA